MKNRNDIEYWMSPTGKVTACRLFGYCEKAIDIIHERGWYEEYQQKDLNECRGYYLSPVGFLHDDKNYIRWTRLNNGEWRMDYKWRKGANKETKIENV